MRVKKIMMRQGVRGKLLRVLRGGLAVSVAAGLASGLGGCAGETGGGASQQGQNVPKSVEITSPVEAPTALAMLTALAESGDVGAQYDLGLTLADSDPKAAERWLENAALQGQGAAAYHLGVMQDNPKRAVEWFSMASAMGHVGAQYELGEAYLEGRGTAQEPGWGLMWLEHAARAGDARGQLALGKTLSSGVAVPARRNEALVWLMIAQAQNAEGAEAAISALKVRVSSAAFAAAQVQAASWANEPVSGATEGRATMRFVQYALDRLGFDAGPTDGIDGERTWSAITAFRKAEKLNLGDGVDGAMLDRLRERLAVRKRG